MAAITTVGGPVGSAYKVTRTSAATVVDWIDVPSWAHYAKVYLQITSITTSLVLSFLDADPVARDDGSVSLLKEVAAFTTMTNSTATYVVDMGPGVTGIADDSTMAAAADSYASFNCVLPFLLGISQVNTGSSVYTLTVAFRK